VAIVGRGFPAEQGKIPLKRNCPKAEEPLRHANSLDCLRVSGWIRIEFPNHKEEEAE
jgi:hypothetical protein